MTSKRSDNVIDIDWLPGSENASRFDGHEHGASVSFFINRHRPDTGPDLHRHPYEESFIVLDGKVRFTLGEETLEATAGQIVVVPAGTPHKFVGTGASAKSAYTRRPGWIRSGSSDERCASGLPGRTSRPSPEGTSSGTPEQVRRTGKNTAT